jgi:hypothetical protein
MGNVFDQFNTNSQKPKNGPENDYTQAMGLLGKGSAEKNTQGAGSALNGNSYDMGQALSGLWKSGGQQPIAPAPDTSMSEGGGGGGGMDMGSMASMAMAFI